ncbi:CU044_2847 family protein [Streptomyces sp. NPDC002935]|uniref:CU044_2847 family protein n=1 Tax=unclassified Streptomyces TaxID=2593676 RepID=UPI0033215B31
MDGLVEFTTDDGALVVVEGVEDESGSRLVARDDGTVRATRTFEGALEGVRAAAQSALRVFRDGSLRPDSVEIEFGVKLTAEAGALIAKSAVEGHLVVKLSWSPGESERNASGAGGTPGADTPGTGAGTRSTSGPEPGPEPASGATGTAARS